VFCAEEGLSDEQKHVAIFFWQGYLHAAPSILNSIRVLSEEGFIVDVITRDLNAKETALFTKHIQAVLLKPLNLMGYNERVLDVSLGANLNAVIGHGRKLKAFFKILIYQTLKVCQVLRFIHLGWSAIRKHQNTYLIGVDQDGLIPAGVIGILTGNPIIYWSLEMTFARDYSYLGKFLKYLEKIFHRRAALTIIQDWDRARSLAEEHKVDLTHFIIVPNGPLGKPVVVNSDYFQKKFHLRAEQKVILHAGLIGTDARSLELAAAVVNWRESWNLVFHSSIKRDITEPILQAIQQKGGEHVYLSLDPVTYDKLDVVMSSGHIGLVIYAKNRGSNYDLMAGASGKAAHYLRCGLPIICIDLPSLAQVINEYQCGLAVENLQEVASAVEKIFLRYAYYRTNAFRCYEEVYEFGSHFRQVSQYLHTRFSQ
jgi:hypothetical protein